MKGGAWDRPELHVSTREAEGGGPGGQAAQALCADRVQRFSPAD
jgi:hypothetical protein